MAAIAMMMASSVEGSTTRTQQVALQAGWNAIYVEVDPLDDAPSAVFDPAKVDVVARYFSPLSSVRMLDNPADQSWTAPGWNVYYAGSRPEAFLTTLHAIEGGTAYLVHALKDATLSITGEAKFVSLRWMVDSFNLTGFPVEGATPTFAKFFAGAGGKLGTRVYRLVDGSWQKVTDLAATQIRNGEACWVYCEGSTGYQGPLDLRFTGRTLDFGRSDTQLTLEYISRLSTAFGVTVAVESNDGLPLYRSIINIEALATASTPLTGTTSLGMLPAAGVERLRLELRREFMTAAAGSAVLKLATTDGIVLRIPVRAAAP